MSETEYFHDRIGRAVRVGDRIAYAVTWGRSASLKVGTVLAIEEKPSKYRDWKITVKADSGMKNSFLEHPERTVLVKSAQQQELETHPLVRVEPLSIAEASQKIQDEYGDALVVLKQVDLSYDKPTEEVPLPEEFEYRLEERCRLSPEHPWSPWEDGSGWNNQNGGVYGSLSQVKATITRTRNHRNNRKLEFQFRVFQRSAYRAPWKEFDLDA